MPPCTPHAPGFATTCLWQAQRSAEAAGGQLQSATREAGRQVREAEARADGLTCELEQLKAAVATEHAGSMITRGEEERQRKAWAEDLAAVELERDTSAQALRKANTELEALRRHLLAAEDAGSHRVRLLRLLAPQACGEMPSACVGPRPLQSGAHRKFAGFSALRSQETEFHIRRHTQESRVAEAERARALADHATVAAERRAAGAEHSLASSERRANEQATALANLQGLLEQLQLQVRALGVPTSAPNRPAYAHHPVFRSAGERSCRRSCAPAL